MPFPIRLIPKAAGLHTKLMLTLTILITLVVAFIASLMIEHEREARYLELEKRADRLSDLASQLMAYSVWNVDLVAIDEQLNSLASDPEVTQCTITAVGFGKIYEVNKPQIPLVKPIVRIQDINFTTAETGLQKIGEVHIVLTRVLVEKAISAAHRTIWMLVALILTGMYAATFLLLKRVVSAPVNRMGAIVDRIALGDLNARCTVESGDELGRLADRVNTMADRLQESDRNMRDSEKRMQLVLDGSQLGYWDWNIETGEVIRDARWAEMLGYTVQEIETSVKQWTDLHHRDDKALVWKSIKDHLEDRTPAHDMEYRMRTKDGQYKWILDQGKIVSRDIQGKPLRMCGTHRDITDRKLAEKEREKLQNQLTQSQKMESIGQLAGGMAHDFNNILSGILSASQMLKSPRNGLNEKSLKYVDMITHSSIRAADLIRKLLAFSRKSKIVNTALDVHQILKDTADILRETVDRKISISLTEDAHHHKLNGDLSAIESAFLNLGINASHAMPDGGELQLKTGNIILDQKYCDSSSFDITPGEFLQIEIKDTGHGIPEENLQKIFEPFFTTKVIGHGTGLGLSAVYGTILDHHGLIEIFSEVGSGTTFNILFPCSEKLIKKEKNSNSVVTGSGTILLVDDEKINRIVNKDILESIGYKVYLAENGLESINVFSEKYSEIDIVLMDMIMPEMNGSEAFHKMKEIDENCKVIITSGYTQDENIDGLIKIGLAGFIEKPYKISEISQILNDVMKKDLEKTIASSSTSAVPGNHI